MSSPAGLIRHTLQPGHTGPTASGDARRTRGRAKHAPRQWLTAAVLLALLATAVSGCSQTSQTPSASPASTTAEPEHAVIVHASLSNDDMGTEADLDQAFAMEDRLIAAIGAAAAGELDGNEIGGGEVVFYAYGPDAQALYEAMAPELSALRRPAYAILRFGDVDDPTVIERRIDL